MSISKRVGMIGTTAYFLNNPVIGSYSGDNLVVVDEAARAAKTYDTAESDCLSTLTNVGLALSFDYNNSGVGGNFRAECALFDQALNRKWVVRTTKNQSGVRVGSVVHVMSDGVVHWSKRTETMSKLSLTDGSTLWSVGGISAIVIICSDSAGNVYTNNGATSLSKWDSTGNHQWTRIFTANIRQFDVNKTTGDIAATYGSGGNFYTALVNTSGTQQWVRSLAATAAGSSSVAFDRVGNVFTIGFVNGGTPGGYYIAKYDSSGTLAFHRKIKFGTDASASEVGHLIIDVKDRLVFAAYVNYVFRLPTTVPLGTYTVNSVSVVISAGSLTASTPAHTLTNGSFTPGTAYPLDEVETFPWTNTLQETNIFDDVYRGVTL